MSGKKKQRFWGVLAVVTVIVCMLAFMAHAKNWVRTSPDALKVFTGFYYTRLPYADIDSVLLVDRIPPMVRLNGFSAFDTEKGVYYAFQDSLDFEGKKIRVYVDDYERPKIKLVHHDSLKVYLNLKDSLKTDALYRFLEKKIVPGKE